MDKVLINRSNNVVDTGSGNIGLKQVLKRFTSSADTTQNRIHVENQHLEGRFQKESSVHNNIMHDVNRHRGTRFQNKPFFKVERIHDSFITEFGKRRIMD